MKRNVFLSTDFETTGFSTVMTDVDGFVIYEYPGMPRIGAAYHGILEGCFRLLDEQLNLIGEVHCYVRQPQYILDRMEPDTQEFHNKTHAPGIPAFMRVYMAATMPHGQDTIEAGLYGLDRVSFTLEGKTYTVDVADSVKAMEAAVMTMLSVKLGDDLERYSYKADTKIQILGKSVGFDLSFIQHQMPDLSLYISHQPMDVSVFKTAGRAWSGMYLLQEAASTHNAWDDCISAEADAGVIRDLYKSLPKRKHQRDAFAIVASALNTWHRRFWRWLRD